MIPSRLITGIVFIILGLVITILSFFTIIGFFYGLIIIILGIYMLAVDNEDKIEQVKKIKSGRKK